MKPASAVRCLRKHYAAMNVLGYEGRLPEKISFRFEDLRDDLALVEVTSFRSTPGIAISAVVIINERLLWCKKLLIRELLHEVVHIGRPDLRHGWQFEKEMLRVRRSLGSMQLW